MLAAGARGVAPPAWQAVAIGRAASRREGDDLTIVSVGVGVHRAMEAAEALEGQGISAPYARHLEDQALPNSQRIVSAALRLMAV